MLTLRLDILTCRDQSDELASASACCHPLAGVGCPLAEAGALEVSPLGNPSHSPIGKHFPNSKYENVKNKQIQLFIFAPAEAKILDLFDSEHPYLESRKSLLREFTPKGDFILMATGVPAFLYCVV